MQFDIVIACHRCDFQAGRFADTAWLDEVKQWISDKLEAHRPVCPYYKKG